MDPQLSTDPSSNSREKSFKLPLNALKAFDDQSAFNILSNNWSNFSCALLPTRRSLNNLHASYVHISSKLSAELSFLIDEKSYRNKLKHHRVKSLGVNK
jgi:hypothetical protein